MVGKMYQWNITPGKPLALEREKVFNRVKVILNTCNMKQPESGATLNRTGSS